MADRHIFLHCFALGSILESIGRILKNNDIDLHTFVANTLSAFHITQISHSTMQCFVFHQCELIRIIDTDFLKDGDDVYICAPEDKQTMKKYLAKKERKVLPAALRSDDRDDGFLSTVETGKASRSAMGRNSMERLEYHLCHYNDHTYSK
tara:strand:+ start:284 stop:733 length:450 start_codon:yes stop_codon:yes gene_type:complete